MARIEVFDERFGEVGLVAGAEDEGDHAEAHEDGDPQLAVLADGVKHAGHGNSGHPVRRLPVELRVDGHDEPCEESAGIVATGGESKG